MKYKESKKRKKKKWNTKTERNVKRKNTVNKEKKQ